MAWRVRPAGRPSERNRRRCSLKRVRPSGAINWWPMCARYRPIITLLEFNRNAFAVRFSSSVKLHYYGRRTISGKLLAIGFAATMRLLSSYFDLFFHFSVTRKHPLFAQRDHDARNNSCSRLIRRLVKQRNIHSVCTAYVPRISFNKRSADQINRWIV